MLPLGNSLLSKFVASISSFSFTSTQNSPIVKFLYRNLTIGLFCVDVNENDEIEATNLLKSEFPRGSKVKIKPFGYKENLLIAKVFNIKGTKEMTELLVAKDLTRENCPN